VGSNHNRNGGNDSSPSEQGKQQVDQWRLMAEVEAQRAGRSQCIWSGVGYSLAIPVTGNLPTAGIGIAESWTPWLSGALVAGFGVSVALLQYLKVVSRWKVAERIKSLFQSWIADLDLASFKLSNDRLTRRQVEALLQRLYNRLQQIRAEIRDLREQLGLTPPGSEFT
jgi:hypothetical protein